MLKKKKKSLEKSVLETKIKNEKQITEDMNKMIYKYLKALSNNGKTSKNVPNQSND